MRGRDDRARLVRAALDLRPDAGAALGGAIAASTAGRGSVRYRAAARTPGAGVRHRSGRRGTRVPQAPRLVREGAPGISGAAQATAPGRSEEHTSELQSRQY